MPIDAYLQVAPDNTGKKVDMDQVASAAGDTIYRQRATLVGETGDTLQQILNTNMRILMVLRAILANQQMMEPTMGLTTHEPVSESDFNDTTIE